MIVLRAEREKELLKHKLKAKYYLRYVDDFVILHRYKSVLQEYALEIKVFLESLKLELHPTKSQIAPLAEGVGLLGFKVFYTHKLVRKRNLYKILNKFAEVLDEYEFGICDSTTVLDMIKGWNAYAMHGNTYNLRKRLSCKVEQELQRRTSSRQKIFNVQ
ncbi:RNA-directed DNA polymerase [Candidatus Woesearchaeota archaeon]|nr:RNA-directed DNA polymerase [Candidatus Woesearchaeota archaeon]